MSIETERFCYEVPHVHQTTTKQINLLFHQPRKQLSSSLISQAAYLLSVRWEASFICPSTIISHSSLPLFTGSLYRSNELGTTEGKCCILSTQMILTKPGRNASLLHWKDWKGCEQGVVFLESSWPLRVLLFFAFKIYFDKGYLQYEQRA